MKKIISIEEFNLLSENDKQLYVAVEDFIGYLSDEDAYNNGDHIWSTYIRCYELKNNA